MVLDYALPASPRRKKRSLPPGTASSMPQLDAADNIAESAALLTSGASALDPETAHEGEFE